MPLKTLSSQKRFSGRLLRIREDRVQFDNGREVSLEILEHAGSVAMVPVDDDGGIWFVRQYRHAAGLDLLELPAGTRNPQEDPAVSANRELREEIGLRADRLTLLGGFFLAPGYATEYMHVFLAEELHPDRLPGDEDEILFPEKIPWSKVKSLIGSGEFQDAKTVAALALAIQFRNSSGKPD